MRARPIPVTLATMLWASALTTLGAVPVFLLSAQSVFVREELAFDEAMFGVAVSCFFIAAAATALSCGRLVDRLGVRVSTMICGSLAGLGGFLIGAVAWSFVPLAIGMAVLGVANGFLQMTANLALAIAIPPARQGLAFGIKQSAVPLAILIGGVSVPVVGATVGWRTTFVATGVVGVLVALRAHFGDDRTGRSSLPERSDRPPRAGVLLSAIAIGFAASSANALGAFAPAWAFEVGLDPSAAGWLIALGGSLTIVGRVLAGHAADRRGSRNLPVVARQMLVGSVGLILLALGSVPTVVIGTLVAFAVGWAWPGLFLFAVLRVARDRVSTSASALQAGAFVGGAAGPPAFGLLVTTHGYPVAWRLAAVMLVFAAVLVLLARRIFVVDIALRPLT